MSVETFICAAVDGSDVNGASRGTQTANIEHTLFPSNFFYPGRAVHLQVNGRITCIVTTPGTLTLDLGFGSGVGTGVTPDPFFVTGPISLNVVAKTTVPWTLDLLMVCRKVSSWFVPSAGFAQAEMFVSGWFASEGVVGAPLPSAGGNGFITFPSPLFPGTNKPFNPADSLGINLKLVSLKTVASAFQCHNYVVEVLN